MPHCSTLPQALSPSKRQEVRGETGPQPYRRFIVPHRYVLRIPLRPCVPFPVPPCNG